MGSSTRLQVDYLTLAERGSAQWDGVLGVAAFSDAPQDLDGTDVPIAEINTPVLGGGAAICEVWRTQEPIESGRQARVRYRRDDNILFGCISVPETAAAALQTATEQAYREIFSALDSVGYRNLLRVWNYVAEINADHLGTERYWQFNQARRDALIASGRAVSGNVPAACALGSASGSPVVVYFLASRSAPLPVENPRQTSAFRYPPKYGPKPVFARASVLEDPSATMLFISGTASIVGHETFHAGDAAAQTRESVLNIEALLGEANRMTRTARFDLASLAYKVYVRHASDLPVIQAQLSAALGAARVVYLQADICRHDLLVEIEATGSHVAQTGS